MKAGEEAAHQLKYWYVSTVYFIITSIVCSGYTHTVQVWNVTQAIWSSKVQTCKLGLWTAFLLVACCTTSRASTSHYKNKACSTMTRSEQDRLPYQTIENKRQKIAA